MNISAAIAGAGSACFIKASAWPRPGQAEARCPRCGGAHLTRLVSRFYVGRPAVKTTADPNAGAFDPESADYADNSGPIDDGEGGMGALNNLNEQMMDGLDDEDPRTIARWARQMQAETGEDCRPRVQHGAHPHRGGRGP